MQAMKEMGLKFQACTTDSHVAQEE